MKKLGKNILLFLFAICMPLFLGACSNNQTSSSFSQKSESNIISSSTNSGLQNGGTYQGH